MPATLSSSYGELVTVSDVFIDGSRYLKPKKGSSKLTENQAKLCVPIGHFLSSPILIEAASRALAHLWHGMLDSADDHAILDLLEQGIIAPVFILASGRETLRVPLSHWTPEKLKRVIPVLRQATELVQAHERKSERTIGPLPLFTVFAVDAETTLPVLEVFCRLFGSDMAASERGYKDFGDFLQRAVTTFLQDGGKIQEDPRYQLLRSAGPKRTKQKDDGHICPEPRIECRTRKQALCLECRDWAPPCFSCGHITCLACLSKEVEKAAGADGEQATPFPICEYCGGSGCATACGEERIGSRMSKDD